uniref:(northern house mosquito) hypothetical protein n=1 Tax=Culex pipiens TaxID=7175 RepID=A0A8D8DH26_CULPI
MSSLGNVFALLSDLRLLISDSRENSSVFLPAYNGSMFTPSASTASVGSLFLDRITCSSVFTVDGSILLSMLPSVISGIGLGPQNDVSSSIRCGDGDREMPDTPDNTDNLLLADP